MPSGAVSPRCRRFSKRSPVQRPRSALPMSSCAARCSRGKNPVRKSAMSEGHAWNISPVDLVRTCLEKIEEHRDGNAFITVCGDAALSAAKQAESEIRDAYRG